MAINLLFLLIIATSMSLDTKSQDCDHLDYPALIAFKGALTNPDNPSAFMDWEGCEPCGIINGMPWNGIICKGNRVTQIRLNNSNLDGSFPDLSDTGGLEQLLVLMLLGNDNISDIHNIGALTKLIHLQLGNSNIYERFPESFCDLTSLTYLNLSFNDMHDTLPSCITQLESLTHFSVNGNNFQGALPEFGGTDLKWMSFYANDFEGPIPGSYGDQDPDILYLNDNNLDLPYDSNLASLCPKFGNENISDENDLMSSMPWEEFCDGVCNVELEKDCDVILMRTSGDICYRIELDEMTNELTYEIVPCQ